MINRTMGDWWRRVAILVKKLEGFLTKNDKKSRVTGGSKHHHASLFGKDIRGIDLVSNVPNTLTISCLTHSLIESSLSSMWLTPLRLHISPFKSVVSQRLLDEVHSKSIADSQRLLNKHTARARQQEAARQEAASAAQRFRRPRTSAGGGCTSPRPP